MNTIDTQITLVGAGPGAPDLITLRGIQALRSAKVIVYDALVDERLLEEAPLAKHLYVGKRNGFKALEQQQINELLVKSALTDGRVVRLKGGDSFVFGRGWEEVEFAQQHGIPVEVIPGISSSISVPALAGIPVTHRSLTTGFHVLTGTLSDGSFNSEIQWAAQGNSTLVVLMGLGKLDQIVEAYLKAGKPDVAVAILSNGSLKNATKVIGTISTIEAIVAIEQPKAPAVIVVGEVVNYSQLKKLTNYASCRN